MIQKNSKLIMKKIILLYVLILCGLSLQAAVRLPRLVSDGMVLQRDAQIRLWGWADPAEAVTLTFNKKSYRATADSKGCWEVSIPAQKAGGPYSMQINNITLNDIYVGDVWVCSGQSNMETPMQRVLDRYADEAAANNPQVRFFVIPHIYASGAQDDLESGEWKAVTPENIEPFSALAYFYAQELFDIYKIPQGIIQSAVGGSAIEAWLSEDVLKHYPKYWHAAQPDEPTGNAQQGGNRPFGAMPPSPQDEGQGKWHLPNIDLSGWKPMDLPGYWADKGLGALNGVLWFRKTITVPAELA